MPRKAQLEMFKMTELAYGGELLKTREGRSGPRPIDSRNSMHVVLRSSRAKGDWSFRQPRNSQKIKMIVDKFSRKYGVKILSFANVGNHLHFHVKLMNRHSYKPFIRAITSAIAMAVTGVNRWAVGQRNRIDAHGVRVRFWDYRPFTRVVQGFRALLQLKDYIYINKLEGFGYNRTQARWIIANSS